MNEGPQGGMVFAVVAVPLFALLAVAQVMALLRRGRRTTVRRSGRAAVLVMVSSLVIAAAAALVILSMLLHRLIWQEWPIDPLPKFGFWGVVCGGATLWAYLNHRLR